MKIAVRGGHQYSGEDKGAQGYVSEIDVDRRYYKIIMQKLQASGHQVLDVTPPENSRSLSDSLYYGINKANEFDADMFISCHVNAYETDKATGCEVICKSENEISTGGKIVNELSALGFPVHRGAYIDDRELAEMRQTNMPALIIEPFFCDNKRDVDIYNKAGDEGIADAVVKGITGQTVKPGNNDQFPVNLAALEDIPIYNLSYYVNPDTGKEFNIGEKISTYFKGDIFSASAGIPGYWIVKYGVLLTAVPAEYTKYV